MISKQSILRIGFIVIISFFLATCSKQSEICTTYTELTGQNNLVNDSVFKGGAQELLDTLTKYPQLQVYRIEIDQYSYIMQCNIFYKGLKIFTDQYTLSKNRQDNSIFSNDSTIVDTINISLTPVINYSNAIKIARQTMNFDNTCISYRLGIYDINSAGGNKPKNYKLTWEVSGSDNGYPYVFLDANSGQVYSAFNGVEQ